MSNTLINKGEIKEEILYACQNDLTNGRHGLVLRREFSSTVHI